ncbi:hypothetical protein [uncultured Nevskia sp.]|uniref:hypothetical protein n=1 Tax=uncultured Nevskia sp. TaxID=228950 RepID=UPI0025F2AFD6|nr:hypothetical protein [uncultured Nevskia sp.]
MTACFAPVSRIAAAVAVLAALPCLPAHADQFQPSGEVRGYPSGAIVSGALGKSFGDNWYGALHGAWNFVDRGNNGKFDNEKGGGFGIGGTVDKYFEPRQNGWFLGGRAELFFLNIDYRDPGVRGSSDITVFQPTARAGYGWTFGDGHYGLTAALSLGAEINVDTSGADVGEGAIVLGGLAFTFKP